MKTGLQGSWEQTGGEKEEREEERSYCMLGQLSALFQSGVCCPVGVAESRLLTAAGAFVLPDV